MTKQDGRNTFFGMWVGGTLILPHLARNASIENVCLYPIVKPSTQLQEARTGWMNDQKNNLVIVFYFIKAPTTSTCYNILCKMEICNVHKNHSCKYKKKPTEKQQQRKSESYRQGKMLKVFSSSTQKNKMENYIFKKTCTCTSFLRLHPEEKNNWSVLLSSKSELGKVQSFSCRSMKKVAAFCKFLSAMNWN